MAPTDGLIHAPRQLALHIAANPTRYPEALLTRIHSAVRHWFVRADTLIDKMMAVAAMDQLIDASRFVRSAEPIPLFSRSDLSMRTTYEGEFRFAGTAMGSDDTLGANILFKRNYTTNLFYALMENRVAASERPGCDFWKNIPPFERGWWHRMLNPAGEVLALVAEPAFEDYSASVARLNQLIALTNAITQKVDPATWDSPLECWQSKYLSASAELCLVPGAELAGQANHYCLPYQLEKLEGS